MKESDTYLATPDASIQEQLRNVADLARLQRMVRRDARLLAGGRFSIRCERSLADINSRCALFRLPAHAP